LKELSILNDDVNKVKTNCADLRAAIVYNGLCCGCGACVGVCATAALSIDSLTSHEPLIDEAKCTACGLCLAVCPGQGYPVAQWAAVLQGEGKAIMLADRGPVLRYMKGHSTDPDIRMNASSGGVATALMLHLLKTGQVDEVAVIGMEKERPATCLTSNPKVVLDAMMSKYGPVTMLASLIPELRKRPRRIAMTVTPCQLGGWMRAVERIPKLRESSVLTIGLFCGQIQSYDALTSIAATVGLRYPGAARFTGWRHGAYPGSARFECPDGVVAEKPLYAWLDVAVPHFSLRRCFLCPDGGNWLADMTLGDNHHGCPDETVIVCRTRRGLEVLESAHIAGEIALTDMAAAEADQCVIRDICYSKLMPAIVINAWLRSRGAVVPGFDYDEATLVTEGIRRLARFWIWRYRLIFWARTGWRRQFLLAYPALLEKFGHFLYYFPASLPGFSMMIRLRKFFIHILKTKH